MLVQTRSYYDHGLTVGLQAIYLVLDDKTSTLVYSASALPFPYSPRWIWSAMRRISSRRAASSARAASRCRSSSVCSSAREMLCVFCVISLPTSR